MNKMYRILLFLKSPFNKVVERRRKQKAELITLLKEVQKLKSQKLRIGQAFVVAAFFSAEKENLLFGTDNDPYYEDKNIYRFIYHLIGPYAANYYLATDAGAGLKMQYPTFTDII